jgi:tripeptidyl-peptidase-1
MFFANYSPALVGKSPTLESIDGGVVQTQQQSFGYNGESDLDLEYAMTLVYPQQVTLYQVGDTVEGASFNNFLDAIDGSYCTSNGGDDPTQDGIYPDPYGGYQGPENCVCIFFQGLYATSNQLSYSRSLSILAVIIVAAVA